MKVVAFTPIKFNSERVPGKNIRKLGKFPLCYYAMNQMLRVNGIDDVFVFCSNSKIKQFIPDKINFLKRDEKLDRSEVKGLEIYKSFINYVDADVYILFHVTSPFVKAKTIQNALDKVISGKYDSACSVKKIQTFTWFKGKPLNYELNNIPRTQEIEPVFYETSSFFIFKKELLSKYNRRIGFKPYLQEVDNTESIDIDEEDDYKFASLLMKVVEGENNE